MYVHQSKDGVLQKRETDAKEHEYGVKGNFRGIEEDFQDDTEKKVECRWLAVTVEQPPQQIMLKNRNIKELPELHKWIHIESYTFAPNQHARKDEHSNQ